MTNPKPTTHNLTPEAVSKLPESAWQDFRPGVSICPLHGQPPGARSSALLRYQPGATVPSHTHLGVEHILVIQGSQQDENGHYDAGTLLISPKGTSHAIASPEGCIVLAVWSDGLEVNG
ncbi:cupin domain-containing protein [uncultured Marinobacter sp.]|uniref:cupin domain-containing protein n=1 Tax=uncultured Marinobacter sp. TaxID=187379 RepID=UPI0030DD6903